MGWSEFGKLAKSWSQAAKTELLATDRHAREAAERERDRIEDEARQKSADDATYAFLDRVLPADLAAAVKDSRPENRAARREAQRREQLYALPTARVQLQLSGAESGALDASVPYQVSATNDDGGCFWLELELADPIAFGTTTFCALSVRVPAYHGPGRYDLLELWRRAEAGELPEWDLTDTCLRSQAEASELDWMWHDGAGPGVIEVGEHELRLDLPMSSAANDVRLQGSVDWSPTAAG